MVFLLLLLLLFENCFLTFVVLWLEEKTVEADLFQCVRAPNLIPRNYLETKFPKSVKQNQIFTKSW